MRRGIDLSGCTWLAIVFGVFVLIGYIHDKYDRKRNEVFQWKLITVLREIQSRPELSEDDKAFVMQVCEDISSEKGQFVHRVQYKPIDLAVE